MKKPEVNKAMGAMEWTMILILSVLWGGSFFFVGVAVKELTPFTIVLLRVGIAAIALLGVVYLSGLRMPSSPRIWFSFIIMGALNNLIPHSLIVWGQTHIASGLASILNATTPIFSVILAHYLTREESLSKNKLFGIFVGWVGVVVLIGFESLKGLGVNVLSQIAVLGAAFSYACAAIYGRQFSNLSPLVVAAGMLISSTVLALPLALILETPVSLSPGWFTIASIIGLAVFSTALAYIIYFKVLASAGATNILLVTFLIPISAILLGVFVLGEQLSTSVFGGMILIFIGLIAIDGRLIKYITFKSPPAVQKRD